MIVYKYGLRLPRDSGTGACVFATPYSNRGSSTPYKSRQTGQGEAVREQMLLAHRYRNDLIAVERGRRAAIRALDSSNVEIRRLAECVLACDARCEAAAKQIKSTRSKTRDRSETEAMRATLRTARAAKGAATKELREYRRLTREDESLRVEMDRINTMASELAKAAYGLYPDLYWGTRAIVDEAMQASKKLPLYDGAEPNDPRFIRWDGSGQIGVQVHQKGELGTGLTVAELASNGHCEIETTGSSKGGRRDFAEVRMRIGTRERGATEAARRLTSRDGEVRMRIGTRERAPVMATFEAVIHRPIPAHAVLRRATITLRKIGPRERWTVELTLQTPAIEAAPSRGVVGLDIGWRVKDDEIRVCHWSGDDGVESEWCLSPAVIAGIRKADELRSIRDKNFEAACQALRVRTDLTDDQRSDISTMFVGTRLMWRSPARLAAIARRWKDPTLETWRYHDYHLWQWETSQRTKALARRKDEYRCFAATLAEYSDLVIEKFDLRVFARRAPIEAPAENEAARSNRQLSSVSELRLALVQAFRSRGGAVHDVDAADTTRLCRVCGVADERDAAASINITCSCGATWDQDLSAARTIRERWSDAPDPGTARNDETPTKEGKRERMRRLRCEREARKERAENTARNPVANAAE